MYIKSLPAYSRKNYINIIKPFLEENKMASINEDVVVVYISH